MAEMGEGGKSITAQHLKRAIDKEPKFDYLVGIVEKVPTVEVGGVGGGRLVVGGR